MSFNASTVSSTAPERATLTDLLVPLNSARDHLATLLLRVRENVEQPAESEGRNAQAVWEEAVERSEERAPGRWARAV